MAESMVGVVVAVIVLIAAATLVNSHYRREHHRERWIHRADGHSLWDRMRHRH